MKVNDKIMVLRKRKGYSQEDLAHELDVSRQAVYKWESGESTPELDKIRKMSTLFEISFDDLLNDDVDITVETKSKKETKEEFKYRKVFKTNEIFDAAAIELEHNYLYLPNSKYTYSIKESDVEKSLETAKKKEEELKNFLQENDYTTDLRFKLLPDATGTFFIDKKKRALGFYFNGAIQFLCPLENIFDISIKSVSSEPVYEKTSKIGALIGGLIGVGVSTDAECVGEQTTAYQIVVSYFNEEEVSEQYKISFNGDRLYSIYARDKNYGRNYKEYRDTLIFNMNNFVKRFAGAIEGIKAEAVVLRSKPNKFEEFDFEKLNNDYQEAKKIVDQQREILQKEWDISEEKRKKSTKIKTFIGLGVAGAIIIFFLICGFIGM